MHGTAAARGIDALKASYSVAEAAQVLGVSERYVWQLISDGALRSFKIANRRRVLHEDLDEYVEQLTARPTAPPPRPRPPAGPTTPPPPPAPSKELP